MEAGAYGEYMNVNERSFLVERLLGKGKGGYSYLVSDGEKRYVIKQIHHEPCDYYQFGNKLESELRDYKTLSEIGIRMPKLLCVDEGKERLLKEYIEGETVFDLVLKDKPVDDCIRQVKQMCEILYPRQINIDYFPTNFVLQDGLLYYIDYECNGYMEQWDFENWGILYWSRTQTFMDYLKKK